MLIFLLSQPPFHPPISALEMGGPRGAKQYGHGVAHGRAGKENGHGQGVSVADLHYVVLIG